MIPSPRCLTVLLTKRAVISLVHGCVIEMNVISSQKNTHNGFLVQEIRVIMVRKARWKSLNHPALAEKMVNQNQCHIPSGMLVINFLKVAM